MAVEQLQHIIHREPWATWLRPGGCLESAHCELIDLLSSVIAADRAGRPAPVEPGLVKRLPDGKPYPTPPAEGEVGELAAELRHFLAGYQQMRGLDPEYIYSIHRGDAMEAHLRVSRLIRASVLLQQQAAELMALRRTLVPTPPAEGEVGELAAALRLRAAQNPMGTADLVITRAAALLQQQAAELMTLRQLAEEMLALVRESDGVAGLHLNGDLAPWDELLPGGRFERLTSLPLEERPHG